jgi:hypothetical protein
MLDSSVNFTKEPVKPIVPSAASPVGLGRGKRSNLKFSTKYLDQENETRGLSEISNLIL